MKNSRHVFSIEEMHTFAKHMICPREIKGQNLNNLGSLGLTHFEAYPYSERLKKNNVSSDPSLLLDEMIRVFSKEIDPSKEVVILLSDGKDSMSLAIALSKMKIKCKTLTLLRNGDHSLRDFVQQKALELGHTPYFVDVEQIFKEYDKETFLNACREMDNPVLDQGFLFFVFAIKIFFKNNELEPTSCQFIDGLGNDEYLGYLPSKSQLRAFKLSKLKLWKYVPESMNWLKWYLRSPAEAQGDLSALACFYSFNHALDINKYFSRIPSRSTSEFVDFRAFSRGNFHDHQCMIGKTKSAAHSFGAEILYPWTDPTLASYCFNLPSQEKYDFDRLVNKICLRKLLKSELEWEQEKRGIDLFFDIDLDVIKSWIDEFVDYDVYKRILVSGYLPNSVRKRAMLELLNLCGYLYVNGMDKNSIKNLLLDY
ncbi:hypothetical protein [Vibrio sp. 1288]|uniref:hypothetical protein n=1 Tax=Vibrio sp. 1288 TaxID=3074550 RepID=UPI0028086E3C|nr:hypothetical protein [Vibrio sp. 1288]ELA9203018.1 hypothetical protein [Vibrio alginolyticus]MDW3133486.1 hypothetical protein [Vibrio sp. 1288]